MPFGPACPNCAKHVPLIRTQWNLGTPFPCARCSTSLLVPKSNAFVLGFGLLAAFFLFRSHFPEEWGGPFGLFALMIVLGLPLTWAATRVKRTDVG